MPEARDRLQRPLDLSEPYRWGSTPLTGPPAAGGGGGGATTPIRRTPRARRSRGSSARRGRENISPAVIGRGQIRQRRGVLPSWYPRRPLQDITSIARAYERRRERLREGEDEQPETPLLRDQSARDPSVATPGAAQLEHKLINSMVTPCPTLKGLVPPLEKLSKILSDVADDLNSKEGESLTPQRKLLNSIETVEKVFKEELQKMQKTPSAKRAEREKKVRTLMSMR